jgi:hypothetical protein
MRIAKARQQLLTLRRQESSTDLEFDSGPFLDEHDSQVCV